MHFYREGHSFVNENKEKYFGFSCPLLPYVLRAGLLFKLQGLISLPRTTVTSTATAFSSWCLGFLGWVDTLFYPIQDLGQTGCIQQMISPDNKRTIELLHLGHLIFQGRH